MKVKYLTIYKRTIDAFLDIFQCHLRIYFHNDPRTNIELMKQLYCC